MNPRPGRQYAQPAAKPRVVLARAPRRGSLRALQYAVVFAVIAGALLFLTPYVGSEPVNVAPEIPDKVAKAAKHKKNSENFWGSDFPTIKVSFTPEEWEFLHRDNRRYVKASIEEGAKVYPAVALKLKGSAGSFQGPEGKPGLTLNFDYYKKAERFHGLDKVHFNNGAQDGTFLQEKIAGEMARKAGVPASRCSHGFVVFQGRDLGLYVVKEAFDKNFLEVFFKNPKGQLFDGGFVHDLDVNMEVDEGDPTDKSGIKELIAAAGEGDNAKRWERLGKILDVDAFASYCAMEAILCHWDGYSFNRNNYRLFRDADTGKFTFFLHGMDQTFGDANFPLMRDFGASLSNAYMRCPEGQKLYKTKLESIYANVLKPIDWGARVSEVGERVRVALEKKNPQWAKDYVGRINEARSRIEQRIAAVGKQLGDIPKPFEFDKDGVAKIPKDWHVEGAAAQVEERMDDGKACLYIRADGDSSASWRRSVQLEPGKYRFEARLRTKGVVATETSSGAGAGLRISGGTRTGQNALTGDQAWQVLSFPFESTGAETALVAELRGNKGEVWIEKGSLQLRRDK